MENEEIPFWLGLISTVIISFFTFAVIPFNLITIDWLGRKWTLTCNFIMAGVFFLLVQICTSHALLTVFIFGVRTFASGIFNAVYIYTSEVSQFISPLSASYQNTLFLQVFPTVVRSLGLGSCSAMARLGAMITPFVAQVRLHRRMIDHGIQIWLPPSILYIW
jgi:hypothetical protein